jgi:hypothetical protein
VQTLFDHYRISFDGLSEQGTDGVVLFAALDPANRRSIAIPKSAQFVLTVRSNAAPRLAGRRPSP